MAAKKPASAAKTTSAKKPSASSKGKSAGKKKTSAPRRSSAELARQERERRNQMWAIILFALGILLTVLAFFEGSSGWKMAHDVLRGLFGPISFGVGPCVIYLAVIITL